MRTLNRIEYVELKNKIAQINDLTNKVEENFNKIDELIIDNINSGRGIWDGEDANKYLDEWKKIKEEIPNSINIFRIQADNIKKVMPESPTNL